MIRSISNNYYYYHRHGGEEPAVPRVAGLRDGHPEGRQPGPQAGLQLLRDPQPEPGPGGAGAVLGGPRRDRGPGGLGERRRADLQHREGGLHGDPAVRRGRGGGRVHRAGGGGPGPGNVRGDGPPPGLEGGEQPARGGRGRGGQRVPHAAESGAQGAGRYRRQGERAPGLGPGAARRARLHRQEPAGRLAGPAAARVAPGRRLPARLGQDRDVHGSPPGQQHQDLPGYTSLSRGVRITVVLGPVAVIVCVCVCLSVCLIVCVCRVHMAALTK